MIGPTTGDIWRFYDVQLKQELRHYLFDEKIKDLNEETQTWYALCIETGEYKKTYWFTNPTWVKVS